MTGSVTEICSSTITCLTGCCSHLKPASTDPTFGTIYKVQVCIPDKTTQSGSIPCAALSSCAVQAAAASVTVTDNVMYAQYACGTTTATSAEKLEGVKSLLAVVSTLLMIY